MPIDPMTGQELPYYGSYGSSGGGQLASTGARMAGVESPLAFDVLGSAPGLTSMAMFNARRGANTIMKGGFLDTQRTAGAFLLEMTHCKDLEELVLQEHLLKLKLAVDLEEGHM